MSRLDEILLLVEHMPPFPKVAQQVMKLLADPNTTASQLAEVIQYDQAITVNVLKICNAAYFSLPRKVSSLDEGLVVIGHDILKDIIITSSSARFFKGEVGKGYDLGSGELWRHSVASGIMGKLLVKNVSDIDSSSVFTTALLHDIGKRLLSSFVSDDFEAIVTKVERGNYSFCEAEQEVIGVDHAELGAMIFAKWDFPHEMAEAVRHHHDADALAQDDLIALVALANGLVISMGIGVGVNGLATSLQEEGLKRFGLGENEIQLCMADLLNELAKAEELLNL